MFKFLKMYIGITDTTHTQKHIVYIIQYCVQKPLYEDVLCIFYANDQLYYTVLYYTVLQIHLHKNKLKNNFVFVHINADLCNYL